ncbi:hypothetical protein [Cupriavidus pauculus]|uniref:Uncharacterized protein n=1 Tax=Cupriavidus pauculus TaxID=82633 RepID=A0A2N5C908_9BURK|nr:hypothetical protein [Cupriavidus pauculus]PLP98708.1 hypothetical protein CYJ10_20625 [Cupriavidus pauculus]
MTQQPRYVGGLAAPQRQTTATRASSREIEALHHDVDALWQEIARLQQPSAPPDFTRLVAGLESGLRDLTKRIDELEKGLPSQIKKAVDHTAEAYSLGVAEAMRDHFSPLVNGHAERIDALESASAQQARTFDETIAEQAKRHREIAVLAEWQLSTACERLVAEFRRHVAEH